MKSSMAFDALAKLCNEFLWNHMYRGRPLEFGSDQHRDLVRTFFAGAFEVLMAIPMENNHAKLGPLLAEYEKMAAVNWRPDGRFMPPTP